MSEFKLPYTTKILVVEMPDGLWGVPAHLVCASRADYYADEGGPIGSEGYRQAWAKEYEYTAKDHGELLDWAANNMNWEDVKDGSFRVEGPPQPPIDYEEGWMNGEKKVKEASQVRRLGGTP